VVIAVFGVIVLLSLSPWSEGLGFKP
jgi:hypothetical protein